MTRPPARSDRSRGDRRPRPPRRDAGRTAPVQPEEVNPAELPTGPPPPLPPGGLRVVALGGIGEVGRNMTVFEHDGRPNGLASSAPGSAGNGMGVAAP